MAQKCTNEQQGSDFGFSRKEAAVFVGLLVFGGGYNTFVEWLEREGYDRGYTAFLVVLGTLVTLFGGGVLVGWRPVAKILLCFGASGFPMIVGSVARYVRDRAMDQAKGGEIVQEVLGDGKTGSKESGRIRLERVHYAGRAGD